MGRQVGVEHRAEGQAIIPAAAEVCDINVLKIKATIPVNFDSTQRNIYNPGQKSMENQFLGLTRPDRIQHLSQAMNVTPSQAALQAFTIPFNNKLSTYRAI